MSEPRARAHVCERANQVGPKPIPRSSSGFPHAEVLQLLARASPMAGRRLRRVARRSGAAAATSDRLRSSWQSRMVARCGPAAALPDTTEVRCVPTASSSAPPPARTRRATAVEAHKTAPHLPRRQCAAMSGAATTAARDPALRAASAAIASPRRLGTPGTPARAALAPLPLDRRSPAAIRLIPALGEGRSGSVHRSPI